MRKVLCLIIVGMFISTSVFGVSEWAKIEPAGTRNASDIDSYITINNEAIDRLAVTYRDNCAIYYVSDSAIGVKAGSVVCSNTAGSLRRFRTNTAVTSNSPVLAASTKYYVYSIADADATTFTLEVVTSASVPTAGTYYKRLGSFYTDSDSDILNDDSLVNDNNYYALRLGDWVSKSSDTVYQASTDGFIVGRSTDGTNFNVYSDASNPPTTIRVQDSGSGYGSAACPIKKSDYYKVENAGVLYFIPLSREV